MTFLQEVEKKFPGDRAKLARMSLIEEGAVQQVRMAYLAVIGSHKVGLFHGIMGAGHRHADIQYWR